MHVSDTYVSMGTGPRKVLCLNGWFGHAAGWGPFLDSIDRQEFTYVFMDYRGYGRRMGSGGPYTMEQSASDALVVADHLGWKAFSLLGHSMGGLAMQHVLIKAPERVLAMVGVSPVPAGGVPLDPMGWQLFTSAISDAKARRTIINMTTGNRLTSTWIDAIVRNSMAHSDQEAFAGYLQSWAKDTSVEQVRARALPVLIIAGEHDPAISAAVCRRTWLEYYPGVILRVMNNAGQYAMDETPLALVSEVEAFLMNLF